MISLGNALKEAERVERQRQELVALYLSAIKVCADNSVEISTPDGDPYPHRLSQLHAEMRRDLSPLALANGLSRFESCMNGYRTALDEAISSKSQEIKLVLDLLGETTQALTASNQRVGSELGAFTERLQEAAETKDPARLRSLLAQQVSDMKEWVSSIQKDTSARIAPLERQVKSFEDRLREVEQLALTDPLTKLWNRREGERLGALRMDRHLTFCLLVIDVNSFKKINDRFGHVCGDEVLKFVASRLGQSVRATDAVCRWGGDEFVIIIDCDLAIAERRISGIRDRLVGPFPFTVDGHTTEIPVRVSVGAAEYLPGESFSDLFHRADLEMYRQKRAAALAEDDFASVYANS